MNKLTTILSIAGSDSSGGAGIQADIKTAAYCNIYASSVITAVTSQSSSSITDVTVIPSSAIRSQLDSVFSDQIPDAIKIGMLGSVENLKTVADYLSKHAKGIPIIADSVMSATSGKELNGKTEEYSDIFVSELSPLATVLTPNLNEANVFLHYNTQEFSLNGDFDATSCLLYRLIDRLGSKSVILKGGHIPGDNVINYLIERTSSGVIDIKSHIGKRIDSQNLHGTGCVFSTLMACNLALGKTIGDSFLQSSDEMQEIIARSCGYTFGNFANGPLNICNYNFKLHGS